MRDRVRATALLLLLVLLAGCSLPPVDLAHERPLSLRSTIRAADGRVLARLGATNVGNEYCENRAYVAYEDVPQVLVDAVLAAEDARFFEHSGFDLRSIARAALVNLREGEVVQGGSTITQQYVKNVYFRRAARTFDRKARELRLAMEIERRYSKEEILERYLNTVYLGSGAYGIKAAAETYFGHGLATVDAAEAALIAGLIKAPEFYNPREHPRRARARREWVLDRMVELRLLSSRAASASRASALGLTRDLPRVATRHPYFVEAVKREVLADPRLGATDIDRVRALCRGGLQIETTLVPQMQRAAEHAVREVLDHRNDPEAALVAIRPRTGEIVAMVGGRRWESSQVNLALGRAGGGAGRQPGSAFKPIALAAALEAGVRLDARYESAPATFTFAHAEPWPVRNAEGGGAGLLPLDEAMVHSVNGVYARLALQLGPGQIATQAKLMGVRAKLPAYPSVVLGAMEVSVLDMAAAYATLANYGTAVEPTTIRHIRLADGAIFKPDQRRVQSALSPGNAYLISRVLEQVIERGTGRAADIGRPAAGKTGTTNNYTDAWFVGYTPDLAVAVWVGYPQGTIPMTNVHGIRVFGGTFPAAIWRSFMLQALRDVPPARFEVPRTDLVTVEIDPVSELLAAPWCSGEAQTMLRQLVPTEHCPTPPPQPTMAPSPTASPSRSGPLGRQSPSPGAGGKASTSSSPSSPSSPPPSPDPSPTP